ncbi:MAG: hypothetical protein L0215_18715 [Gemmataceae bacterium]|nr:hypothetical protein [Gemmataceae bacterium]
MGLQFRQFLSIAWLFLGDASCCAAESAFRGSQATLAASPTPDEALTRRGEKRFGTLQWSKSGYSFLDEKQKTIALKDLHSVRFQSRRTPVPKCRPLHHLLLSDGQRTTGELMQLTKEAIHFRTTLGRTLKIARKDSLGIVQSDSWLAVFQEDFENGKGDESISGKSSLQLSSAQPFTLTLPRWKEGRLSFFFYDEKEDGAWEIRFVDVAHPPVRLLLGEAYRGAELPLSAATVRGSPGWHYAQLEWTEGVARLFVDDQLLGETRRGAIDGPTALECRSKGAKKTLHLDGLVLAKRIAPMIWPPAEDGQDWLWSESGDQLFGNIAAADADKIVLQASPRVFTWTTQRGLFFAGKSLSTPGVGGEGGAEYAVKVYFRSAPGWPDDVLAGQVTEFSASRLQLRHTVLGEVEIPRECLTRLEFPKR